MPITVIGVFTSRRQVVAAIDQLCSLDLMDIHKAAVVAKAEDGETILVDNQVTPTEGRRAGAGLGALMTALGVVQLGAFALPGLGPFIALGTGALLGGLVGGATGQFAAMLIRFGVHSEQVDQLADHLQQGQVALILQLEDRDPLPQIHAELERLDALAVLVSEVKKPTIADFKQLPSSRTFQSPTPTRKPEPLKREG
jgi:uncharacterized membrane protein